jgi:hypothetical protein
MLIRSQSIAATALAGVLAFVGVNAADAPYYKNVSDIEVETSVKGNTYDKANDKTPSTGFFGSSDSHAPGASSCLCACPNSVSAANPGADKAALASAEALNARLKLAISQLSTASWQDAQLMLVDSGKAAVPFLIDALNNSESAFALAGHTKSDAGRLTRQRTVGEVAAELLTDLVLNHTSYKGELPGNDQAAWRDWWSKNADGVKFASN